MAEITKSNIDEMFPVVEKSINYASFISIDTEFTGLKLDSTNDASLFDTLEERYQKLKMRASSFIVSQIGITTFTRCANENRYNAETYVFYVRPHLCGSNDRLFVCQASAIDFLCRFDFDFNKFAKEGLPFINEEEEKTMRQELAEKSFSFPHEITMERSLKRKQDLIISEFLLKCKIGDKITLEKDGIGHDYFQVDELRRKYPSLWAYYKDDKVVLEKVSPEKRIECEREREADDEIERLIQFFLGFTRVFRVLKKAKKPIVGHNFLMDLLFMFNNFHQPLPKTYNKFKKELHEVFPIIFDTKHIWLNVKRFYDLGKIPKESALFDLYHMFQSPPDVLRTLFSPHIIHTNGDKYKVDLPHESGFDSYVTGWVFLKICHLLALKKVLNAAHMEPQLLRQHMKAVEPFKNKVNISMSRTRFIDIAGNDPPPQTSNYLYVTLKHGNLLNKCKLADVFGRYALVEFKVSPNWKAATLAVGNSLVYRDILKDFKNHDTFIVEEYDLFKHYFPAKVGLWVILFGSGVMTSYLAYQLIQLHR